MSAVFRTDKGLQIKISPNREMIGSAAPVIERLVHRKADRSGDIPIIDIINVACLVPLFRGRFKRIHRALPLSADFGSIRPVLTPYLMARMIGPGVEITHHKRRITIRVVLHLHIDQNMGVFEVFFPVQDAMMIYEAELPAGPFVLEYGASTAPAI